MYLSAEEIESGVLRQGDIISEVHSIGALNLNNVFFVNKGEEILQWGVDDKPKLIPAMVLSHSCEIDPANTVKLSGLVLGPIRDVDRAAPSDKINQLIESNIIDEENPQPSFLKYFYLNPSDLLPQFQNGAVVDFSKCYSFRKECYNALVKKKILQLDPQIADKMALKLALYFYRR